jgi:hypothetical protein
MLKSAALLEKLFEGGPFVIGNVMFVHGPFPNPVFALDLNNDGKILCLFRRVHLKPFLPRVSAAVLSKFSPEVR